MTTLEQNRKQISKISKGFTFLATVGSIAIYRIVWDSLYYEFISIYSISRNTSLAIVAPV